MRFSDLLIGSPAHLRRGIISLASVLLFAGVVGAGPASATTWCTNGSTTDWSGGSGNWGTGSWSAGLPNSGCTAVISGDVTVTLTSTPDQDGYTDPGTGVQGLTLSHGATLVIQGQGTDTNGNWVNYTALGVGSGGVSIGSGSTLELESTDDYATPEQGSPGGGAYVQIEDGPVPFTNDGTIIATTTDASYQDYIQFGADMSDPGDVDVRSGTLNLDGTNSPMVVDNTGTFTVASGAAVTMFAGDGSSFTNDGSYINHGSTVTKGSMYWTATSGSESGNPIQLQVDQSAPTLADSAKGGAGAYVFDGGGGNLTGTIPAGQTVEVQGAGTNDTTVGLRGGTVTNDGTLILDAPGSGTGSGGTATLTDGNLANHGTIKSTVEDSSWHDEMQVGVKNEHGATAEVLSGRLLQEGGSSVTNDGLWQVAPGATYELYGGSFTNESDGTLQPEISGAGSYGVINPVVGTLTAGGTLAPDLTSGYRPAAGTEFPVVSLGGGGFSGTFATVGKDFSADYSHQSSSNPYVGVIYSGSSSARPKIKALSGTAGAIRLSLTCGGGRSCGRYRLTGTVTEHLSHGRVTAVSARATRKRAETTKLVTVARATGVLASGHSRTLTVRLNAIGRALLERFGRLRVRVTLTAGGHTIRTTVVTVTAARTKKKRAS